MPGGDKTGPMGNGPMTGRGAGYCAGNDSPGSMNPGAGWGFYGGGGGRPRWGRGGFGHRHWFHATGLPRWMRFGHYFPQAGAPFAGPDTPEKELEVLQKEAGFLEKSLDHLRKRMEGLKKETKKG